MAKINYISTHAPLAGRDTGRTLTALQPNDFNPRAPCGARLEILSNSISKLPFQPTRPLRGATQLPGGELDRGVRFQPTRPLRGATASMGTST